MNQSDFQAQRSFRLTCLFLALAFTNLGCNKLSKEYGLSEGNLARQSPASMSIFRNLCDSEGCDTKEIRSLSPRAMERLKAIVWSPDHFGIHGSTTMEWMNKWLAKGDRTLIYVGRDFSPMADYWRLSADKFDQLENREQERWNALEQQAFSQVELDLARAAVRKIVATPWFLVDYTNAIEKQVDAVTGPWAESIDVTRSRIFVRGVPVGIHLRSDAEINKIFDIEPLRTNSATTTTTPLTKGNTAPVAPVTAPTVIPVPNKDFEFVWNSQDAEMLKITQMSSSGERPQLETLLATPDNQTLIGEIKSPALGVSQSSSGNPSRVLVLANSSVVSNLGLTNDQNRILARRIIASLPKDSIGFLTGSEDPLVRKDDSGEQQKGFEMLTIWPLNVITLHTVFLGSLALIALFPIFGRPKLLPRKSNRDFSLHVDAVGELLKRSKDRFFALATIGDYFRLVRKEPTSPWANVDTVAQQEPKSPFAK